MWRANVERERCDKIKNKYRIILIKKREIQRVEYI
jgi:hypothetical protein